MNMRPYFALLAVGALFALAASCHCGGGTQERRVDTESLAERSVKLPNGLALDLVEGPCGDSAALVVHLAVGIDHDPPGRSGMTHLAGRILATSAPGGRAARAVETGNDFTLYSVVVTAGNLPDELSDVAAWMSEVKPTEADLARERAKVLAELAKLSGGDAPSTAVHLAEESVRPTRGQGKRHGIPAEVEAITLRELVAFWQAHFKPANARITVAGRFDTEKLRRHIETAFGPLPAGTPPVARPSASASVRGTLVMGAAPTAVAVAVPAPAPSDPLYPPFLILAARLAEKTSPARTWEASYDPILRPELLFVTGLIGRAEQPEPGAGRIRAQVAAVLALPPAPADVGAARERFRFFLDPTLDPALCAKDARAFAIARTRRAQMGLEGAGLLEALPTTTKEQLEKAAALFEPNLTAAVIAGGALR
jgi:hypothetical protein